MRRPTIALFALLSLFLLVGCDSDDSNSGSDTGTDTVVSSDTAASDTTGGADSIAPDSAEDTALDDGGDDTTVADTEDTTLDTHTAPLGSPANPAPDCAALYAADASTASGSYTVLAPLGTAVDAWCDFDSAGSMWTRHAAPLRTAGDMFGDGLVETVVADPDVRIDDQGTWHIYYQGSRVTALGDDALNMMIVHGSSSDGVHWTIDDTPLLTSPADTSAWDATHSETPSVVYDPNAAPGTEYKLYYSGAGIDHPLGFSWYQVGVAVSSDGVNFIRLPAEFSAYDEAGALLRAEDVLSDVAGVTAGVLADPEVVIDADGGYHMFVSAFGHDDSVNPLAWGITHLVSADGIFWGPGPDGAQPIPNLPGQQPSVAFNPTTNLWEMVFTQDTDEERALMPSTFNPSMGVMMATSPDLDTWSVQAERDFWWDGDNPEESFGLLTGAALAFHDGQRWLFYKGWGENNIPEGMYVPTHDGFDAAALNLLLATRSAE